jgi:hypothetical protein
MAYVFFTSYSSNNRTKAFERFVATLRSHVFQRVTPALANDAEVTFFAPSTLELGDEWRPRLLDALKESKVIVCFCSPHYLASKYCGKELQVFYDRRTAWLQTPGNEKRRARVIFPVHWVKPQSPLPKALADFQDDHAALPRKYRENGLLALVDLKKERDVVTEVAIKLAQAIVKALDETSLPDLATELAIDDIANIFDEPAAVEARKQWVVCLADDERAWRPYEGEPALESLVEQIAVNSQREWKWMDPADDVPAQIQSALTGGGTATIVASSASVTAPSWQPLWTWLEQQRPDPCAVLVVCPPSVDAASQAELDKALRERLPTFLRDVCHANLNIQTQAALATALAESGEALRLRRDQTSSQVRVVDDADAREEALSNGVDTTAPARVSGSGNQK